MTPAKVPASLFRRIEAQNVLGRERSWAVIPAALAKKTRPRVVRVADALATLMKKSDSLRINRVIGLGHRGQASPAAIDELVALYQNESLPRFSLEIAPGPQATVIAEWLAVRGFRRRGGYTLLSRDLKSPLPVVATETRVKRASRKDLAQVVDVFGEVFSTPASRRDWALAVAAAGDTHYLVAWVGKQVAGAGALRVDGDLGWLVGGAVKTRWRHHGLHSALIAARLRLAKKFGCTRVWSETIAPRAGRPGGSRRNLMRLGFAEIGPKAEFVWERD